MVLLYALVPSGVGAVESLRVLPVRFLSLSIGSILGVLVFWYVRIDAMKHDIVAFIPPNGRELNGSGVQENQRLHLNLLHFHGHSSIHLHFDLLLVDGPSP